MTRSLSRWQAILLGFVVLTAVVLGTVGLFAAGSRHWVSDAFPVRVRFEDVRGVDTGTRVQIQGIDAGEVEAIELPDVPGGPVLLRLRLAGKFRSLVRADARVQIGTENLLTGKVLRILPGSAEAAAIEEDAILTGEAGGDVGSGLAQATHKLNKILEKTERALADFEQGKGPIGGVTTELRLATAKLDRVLAKADATLTDVQNGKGTLGKLLKDDTLYMDLTSALAEINGMLEDVRYGKGTLGQLVKSAEMYKETMQSLQEVRRMVSSVKQNADAIKSLPVVRSYVVDINKELNRPACKRYRMYYPAAQLFEPGRAVLTEAGQEALNKAADWLNEHKEEGSEVVVAAFAEPRSQADFAQTLTQKQAEVAAEYLKTNHSIHRMGFWWWSNRTVKALGCGNTPSPVPEREHLPAARVEFIVFVPEG